MMQQLWQISDYSATFSTPLQWGLVLRVVSAISTSMLTVFTSGY
jgi:hypothetical protein